VTAKMTATPVNDPELLRSHVVGFVTGILFGKAGDAPDLTEAQPGFNGSSGRGTVVAVVVAAV
jgi:hypothetical protein